MMMQRTHQVTSGFANDLNDAIRENPVAAGLIGLGVIWMVLGGAKVSTLGSKLLGAARTITGAVGPAANATGNAVGEALGGTGTLVKDAARQIGDAISSTSEGAATLVRDTVSSGYDAVTSSGEKASQTVAETAKGAGRPSTGLVREFGTSIQQNLSHSLERQPLLLGVIGLAIGAGIASAFPSTKVEMDVMGETGAAVKEKIQQLATDTTEICN
jgi:hypothetical protein